MRSTAAPELALDPHEHEPLLEDYDQPEPDTGFAVVVDGEKVEAPLRRRSNPTLADQVAECLTILREAQAAIPELQKPRVTRQYIYAAVFASLVTAAIAAPAALFGTLFHQIFHTNEELLQDTNARLADLRIEDEKILAEIQTRRADIQPLWSQLFAIIKPYAESFYKHDDHDLNCDGRNDDPSYWMQRAEEYVSLYLCSIRRWYDNGEIVPYSEACNAIVHDGCAAIENRPELIPPIREFMHRYSELSDRRYRIENQISQDEWRIRDGFSGEHFSFAPAAIVAGVGVAAALIAVIAVWRHRVSRQNYREDLRQTHQINACMTDAEDANKLINLLVKLGINMNEHTTVEQLIDRLENRAQEIERRAQRRAAFLLCASVSRANHGFFQPNSLRVSNKDVTNIIFEKAGLGKTAYRKLF